MFKDNSIFLTELQSFKNAMRVMFREHKTLSKMKGK